MKKEPTEENITICPIFERIWLIFPLTLKIKRKKLEERYKKFINKSMNGKEEEKFLYDLLYLNDNKKVNDIVEKVFIDLLKNKKKFTSARIDFLINYIVYKKYSEIKYDGNGKTKEGYESLIYPTLIINKDVTTTDLGNYKTNNGIPTIYITYHNFLEKIMLSDNIDNQVLYKIIQTIYHEMIHYKQEYELTNGILSNSSYNMLKRYVSDCIFSDKDFDEYHINYNFKESEIEAEIISCIDIIKLIKKYFPDEMDLIKYFETKKNNILEEESIAFQETQNDGYYLRDEYDIKSLITIIRNNKSVLKNYPQLNIFFESNGNLKSEEELLKGFKECTDEQKEIYYEFFTYLYGLGDYRDVTNTLPTDLMEIKYEVIKELLKQEVDFYKILDNLDDDKDRLFQRINYGFVEEYNENVMDIRKERISNYVSFLKFYKLCLKYNMLDESKIHEIDNYIELADNILDLNIVLTKYLNDIYNNKLTTDKSLYKIDIDEKKQKVNNINEYILNNSDIIYKNDDFFKEKFKPKNRHL